MSHRLDEELEFVQFGPEECVPDLNKVDIRTIRNMMLLFDRGHCHVDIPLEEVGKFLQNSQLQSTEPFYGGPSKKYYANCRPMLLPPSKIDGDKTEAAQLLLTGLIKKFGGSVINMLLLDCKNNYNMSPHVYRTGCSYGFKAMELPNVEAAMTCACCGIVNLVWLLDETEGLQLSRCGVCLQPLLVQKMLPDCIVWGMLEVVDITQLRVGAIELNNAEITLQLDGQPAFGPTTLSKLIDQDLRNIRSVMSRAMSKTIYVPNGLTDHQKKELAVAVPAYKLLPMRGTPNPHAMLAAERRICAVTMADKRKKGKRILDIGSRVNLNQIEDWHGMGPCLDWRDVERYHNRPLSDTTCDHTVKECNCLDNQEPLLISVDSLYDIDPSDILSLMQRTKSNQLFYCLSTAEVDFNNTNGKLAQGQGEWMRHDDKLITVLRGDDRPYVNNWKLSRLWSTADLVQIGQQEMSIQTVKILGNHIIRVLTLVPDGMDCLRTRQVGLQSISQIDITVPMIDVESWLNVLGPPKLAHKQIKLDLALYRALYSRNLTGGLSYEKLIEFGLGYAHAKYTTKTTTISHQHVTADDVRMHAMLACAATRRKFAWVSSAMKLNATSNVFGLDPVEVTKLLTLDLAGTLIKDIWGTILPDGFIKQRLDELVIQVTKWINDSFWDTLDTLTSGSRVFTPTVYVWPQLSDEVACNAERICYHHKQWCNHPLSLDNLCDCCRLVTALPNQTKCECCMSESSRHECHHKCQGGHLVIPDPSALTCTCCKLQTLNDKCQCCSKPLTKHPDKQQPVGAEIYGPEQKEMSRTMHSYKYEGLSKVTSMPKTTHFQAHVDQPLTRTTEPLFEPAPTPTSIIKLWEEQLGKKFVSTPEPGAPSQPPDNDVQGGRDGDGVEQQSVPNLERQLPTENNFQKTILELTGITDLSYVSNLRYGYTQSVTSQLAMPNEQNPDNRVGVSELKYFPMGLHQHNANLLALMAKHKVAGDGLCAYYALEHCMGTKLSLRHMQNTLGCKTQFSAHQIIKYGNMLGNNVAILTNESVITGKVDPFSDKFLCIMHTVEDGTGAPHWEPCNVVQVNDLETTPCYMGLFKQSQVNKQLGLLPPNLNEEQEVKERCNIVLKLIKRAIPNLAQIQSGRVESTVYSVNGLDRFTNNKLKRHDPGKGLFDFEIDKNCVELMQALSCETISTRLLDELEAPLNIKTMQNVEIDELKISLLRNTVLQLRITWLQSKGALSRTDDNWLKISVLTHKTSKGTRMLALQDTKLKSGDIISVDTIHGAQDRIVWKLNEEFHCLDWLPPTIGTQTTILYVNKHSFKSGLIRAMMLNRQHVDFQKFKTLVAESACTIGPAGSGKSTMIASNWKEGSIAVCKTSSAVKNLQLKINGPSNMIMSHEKYSYTPTPDHHLVLDECSMYTWYDLYFSLTKLPQTLTMYGDPHQISTIDTFLLGGERILDNITDYVLHTHKLRSTYRYGATVCELLSPLLGELSSKAKHDTVVIDLNLGVWDDDELQKIVAEHKPDVVLTHHNITKHRVKRLAPNSRVETIHSFQSLEANNVMVVQYNEGGNSKIYMDKRYAISAITRAKLKVVWVSVGLTSGMKLLDKIRGTDLETLGGGKPKRSEDNDQALQRAISETMKLGASGETSGSASPMQMVRARFKQNLMATQTSFEKKRRPVKKAVVTKANIEALVDSYTMSRQPLLIYEGWDKFVARWANTIPKNTEIIDDQQSRTLKMKLYQCTATVIVDEQFEYYSLQVECPRWMPFVKEKILSEYRNGLIEEWQKHALGKSINDVVALLRPCHQQWFLDHLADNHSPAMEQLTPPTTLPQTMVPEITTEMELSDEEWYDATSDELGNIDDPQPENMTLQELEYHNVVTNRELSTKYPSIAELNYQQIYSLMQPNSPMLQPIKSATLVVLVQAILPNTKLTTVVGTIEDGYEVTINSYANSVGIIQVTSHGLVLKVVAGSMEHKIQTAITEFKVKLYNRLVPYAGIWKCSANLDDQQIKIIKEWYPWLTPTDEDLQSYEDENLLELIKQEKLDIPGKLQDLTRTMRELRQVITEYESTSENVLEVICEICGNECCAESEELNLDHECLVTRMPLNASSNRTIRLCSEWAILMSDIDQQFKFEVHGNMVTISSFGGCSLCSGLKFVCNDQEILRISPQRKLEFDRKVRLSVNRYPEVLMAIMTALHMPTELTTIDVDETMACIDLLEGVDTAIRTPAFELGMVLDRMRLAPAYLWALWKGQEQRQSCSMYISENIRLREEWQTVAPSIQIKMMSNLPGHRSLANRPLGAKYRNVKLTVMKMNNSILCDNQLIASKYNWRYTPLTVMVERYYWLKLNEWPWRLANLLTINGKLANIGLGYDSDLPINSLNLPLSYHETNNTAVNRFLVDKRGEAVISTMKKTYHIVFVSKTQMQNYGPMLARDCEGMPIEEQGCETMDQGFDMLTEQICLKYFYNGLPLGEISQMVTDYPYLSILTSSWANMCTPTDNKYAFRYYQNITDCNNMLEKMEYSYGGGKLANTTNSETEPDNKQSILDCLKVQQQSKTGPWYTEDVNSQTKLACKNILMGLAQCRLSPAEMAELMRNNNKTCVHLIMPKMIEQSNQLFGVASEDATNYKFWYHNSSHLTLVNKDLLAMFQTGQCVPTKHGTLITHAANRVLGHCIVKILLLPNKSRLPKYVRPNLHDNQQKAVTFKLPEIRNFKQFVTTGKAISYKEVTMSLKLYRALSLRMLRPKTTLDDLLAYARTYSHTVAYTISSRSSQQPHFVTELMECCVCVYVESIKLNEAANRVMDLISGTEHPITQLHNLKNTAWYGLVKILADCYQWLGLDTTIDKILEFGATVGKATIGQVIKNIDKLVVVRISKVDTVDPIICYQDSTGQYNMEVNSFKNTEEKIDNMLRNLRESVNWGMQIERNRHELTDGSQDTQLAPTATSKLVDKLADSIGSDRDECIERILPDMVETYEGDEITTAVMRVVKNVGKRLELRPKQTILTCIDDDEYLCALELLEKGKNCIEDCFTIEHLKAEVKELRWMYPDDCKTWEGKTILFSTIGSRGDIEPYIAWAQLVREIGSECKFLVPIDYVSYVNSYGFEAMGLQVNSKELIDTCISAERHKWNPIKLYQVWKRMFELIEGLFEFNHRKLMAFVANADMVIETPFTHIGVQIAQKLKIPCLFSTAYPWEQQAGMTTRADGMTITEIIAGVAAFAPFKKHIEAWRKEILQLHNERGIMVHGVGNPMVYLHPTRTKWWKTAKTSGCVGYASTVVQSIRQTDMDLCAWAGSSMSMAVCFGSMTGAARISLTDKIIDKFISQFNIVVVDSEYKTTRPDDEVMVVSEANYNMLFSCVDVVATHGGSGTVHNALRKECVVMVEPHFGDQLAWLKSIQSNNCGGRLSEILDMSLQEAMDRIDQWSVNAKQLGTELRGEDFRVNLISNSQLIWHKASEHTTKLLANIREPINELPINPNNVVSVLKGRKLKWTDWEIEETLNISMLMQPSSEQNKSAQLKPAPDKNDQKSQGPSRESKVKGHHKGKKHEFTYTVSESEEMLMKTRKHNNKTSTTRPTPSTSGEVAKSNRTRAMLDQFLGVEVTKLSESVTLIQTGKAWATDELLASSKGSIVKPTTKQPTINFPEEETKEIAAPDEQMDVNAPIIEEVVTCDSAITKETTQQALQNVETVPIVAEEREEQEQQLITELAVDNTRVVTVEDVSSGTTASYQTGVQQIPDEYVDITTLRPTLVQDMFQLKLEQERGSPMEVISTVKIEIVCEPQGSYSCAKEVLEKLLTIQYEIDEHRASSIIKKCYQWLQIVTLPRLEDIKALITILDLRVGIQVENNTIHYEHNGPNGNAGYVIQVTGGTAVGHCRLLLVEFGEIRELVTANCTQMTISQTVQDELNTMIARLGCNRKWNEVNIPSLIVDEALGAEIWSKLDTTYTHAELIYKLKGNKLVHTADRMDHPMSRVALRQSNSVLLCDETLTPDRWYWVTDGAGWRGAIATKIHSQIMLLTNSNQYRWREHAMILRTDIKIGLNATIPLKVQLKKKIVTTGESKVTALNRSTLYESQQHYYGVIITGIKEEGADLVAVYDYDNRAHHKYDDKDFLVAMGPGKSVGLGFELTGQLWNKLMSRDKALRHMLHKGQHQVAFEFSNQHQVRTLGKILRNSKIKYVIEGTSVYIQMSSLDDVKSGLLEEWAMYLEMKNGTAPHIDDVLTKYDQWVPLTEFIKQHCDNDNYNHVFGRVNLDNYKVKLSTRPSNLTVKLSSIVKNELDYEPPNLVHRNLCLTMDVLIDKRAGGLDEPEFWKFEHDFQHNNISRWWDNLITTKPKTKFDASRFKQINTEAMIGNSSGTIRTDDWPTGTGVDGEATKMPHLAVREWTNIEDNEVATAEIADYDIMSLWEDTDFSDWNEKFGPKNEVIVRSTNPATTLRVTTKYTMVQYPIYSRPVLTKAANQEFNAVTGRLHNITTYRRQHYNVRDELNKFIKTYFDEGKTDTLCLFANDKLTYNDAKVLDWLRDRPDSNKVAEEVETILQEGMQLHAINRLNVHLKLESLLKAEPASSLKQVKARALLWQCKGYCAIFSHIFKEAKARLKQLLKPTIVYADGLRADELSARVRLTTNVRYLMENDLAQQDKQTDHDIIKFEMELYKLLGVHEDVVNLWHNSHFHWKYKSRTVKGTGDAMRLTGQATTALGNAITNLLVHRKVVDRLGSNLRLFLVLGDDGLMFTSERIDLSRLNNETKIKHNMMCKPHISETFGVFCCMMACITQDGSCSLGPDVVRLRRRFECPNGVSEMTTENAMARAMSYYMMLGATPEVMRDVVNQNLPIKPIKWYDVDSIRSAVADKYNMSDEQVLNEERQLLQMLRERNSFKHDILHWYEGV
uniref:Polyprotein n=1 Tax=Alphaendornavirus sp. TaxID=2683936 RepID=A0A6G7K3W2_9VIRU|nr:polyprotein [Alphaendornavirus sp.]